MRRPSAKRPVSQLAKPVFLFILRLQYSIRTSVMKGGNAPPIREESVHPAFASK